MANTRLCQSRNGSSILLWCSMIKKCPKCGGDFLSKDYRTKHCSRSCSASSNRNFWKNREHARKKSACAYCKKEFYVSKIRKKYCSRKCHIDFRLNLTKERIAQGLIKERSTIRRHLLKERPFCWQCGLDRWWGENLSLQVDHMDGNPANDNPDNLRLLCPNCHSITPFFGGKNRGNGRKSRGMKIG